MNLNLFYSAVVLILSVLAVVFVQKLVGKATTPENKREKSAVPVVVYPASNHQFYDRIEAIGTAKANESITITATVSERVGKILFEEGARVKASQLLVQLEDNEEKADLAEARINVEEQRREFDRVTALRRQNGISEQDTDTARFAYERYKAQLVAAEARWKDRQITAPFAGVLGLRMVSPGALVSAGTEITTLDDDSVIKLDFTVPETFLSILKIGQEIEAQSAAWTQMTFKGTVTGIDSRVNSTTRAVAVQAKLPNEDSKLRAGMLLTIELFGNPRRKIGIPEKTLVAYGRQQFVFTVDSQNVAHKREVFIGHRDAGWVEVESGLQEGEIVVVEGQINLGEGSAVNVVATDEQEPERSSENTVIDTDAASADAASASK